MVSTPISTTSTISSRIVSNQLMNTKVSEDDSLFHICDRLIKRLGQYKPLKPYIESAEMLAEYSSEKQEDLFNNTYKSLDNCHTLNTDNINNNSRPSSTLYRKSSQVDSRRASVSSFQSNGITNSTINNSSIHSPSVASTHSSDILSVSNNQNIYLNNIESNLQQIPTFTIGSLPPSRTKDPVTTLWKLFQMGAPLCIIFNAIKPQYKINVVSSDELKICKKSIYDFISSCKIHLEFHDEELFTISDVFISLFKKKISKVRRRYSDFVYFKKCILQELALNIANNNNNSSKINIPEVPSKMILNNRFNYDLINIRLKELEKWLQIIVGHPLLRSNSKVLKRFIQEESFVG